MTESSEDWGRDRREAVASADLNPKSLVGSWFLVLEAEEIIWQGIIVAEVGPGIYLSEITDSIPGAKRHQLLVAIRQMLDHEYGIWRFYDDESKMREAFAEWELTAKDRA